MNLFDLTLISCAAMVVKDFVGTILVVAEAKGNERLGGLLNAAGTPSSVIFYSFGAAEMLKHGLAGWLCLLPVMCVDYIDGRLFTRLGRRIKADAPEATQRPWRPRR